MNVCADTNVLVRAVVRDNAEEAAAADRILRGATVLAIAVPCLCEFVWVLRSVYGFSRAEISSAIHALLAMKIVAANRPAVEAGLASMLAGGDFADGAIAYEGRWLGGQAFFSFDRKAVRLLSGLGHDARLASEPGHG